MLSSVGVDRDPGAAAAPKKPGLRHRWLGRAALVALAVVTLALPIWAGAALRDRILAEAEREITTQVGIAAAATERRLQSLKFALSVLPGWIDGPALSSEALDWDVNEALGRLADAGGPGIGFLALAPDGRTVASLRGARVPKEPSGMPGIPGNQRNGPNIVGLGTETPSGLAISAPFAARAQGMRRQPMVAVSRALPGGGWVQAIVALEVPSGLLPPTDLGDGSVVWLVRSDGQSVARWPPPVPLPAPRFTGWPAFLDAPGGGASGDAISAYRRLDDYGLVVVVSRDRRAILAPWRAGMVTTLTGILIGLLAAVTLAWRGSRAAAALIRSEDRVTMVADALGLLLWSAASRGSARRFHNAGAEALTGYPISALASRPSFWRDVVVHPSDRERAWAHVEAAGPAGHAPQTYRIVRRDGAIRWVESRARSGADGGIVGVIEDVTALHETEARLATSEAQLAEAMRIAQLGRWRFEPETGAFEMNETLLEQLGVAGKEGFEQTIESLRGLVLPEDWGAVEAALARVRETGETVDFEYRLRRPDGAVRCRWARAAPEDPERPGSAAVLGVGQDITERREAAAQVASASRLAALGQLTGGIAHDVNNMLTVVSLNLDLLADEVAPGTLASEALEAAQRAAAGGSELTTQLLAFARRQPLRPAPVAAATLFGELRPMLARTLGRGVTATLTAAPGTPPVLADAAQLRSALLNLAINARDAMPGGGGITITAEPAASPGEVAFAVADQGSGMPPEVAARAFEPFFTTKPSGKGTGLGLAQVYGFVTQSQGTIAIESAPGAGTVVRFTLPVAPEARAEAPRKEAGPMGGAKVLVVEDEAELRLAVVAMCRSAGLTVADAADAAGALAVLEGGFAPDLLFTDINLGSGPDGVTLAGLARRQAPGLRVLFATGYAAEVEVPKGAAMLRKPYAREALLAALAASLAAAEAPA